MRITKYRTELDNTKKNILVKESAVNFPTDSLSNPESVFQMLNTVFHANKLAEEFVWLIALNNRNKVIAVFEVSHGTVNSSLISPREIFVRLCLCGAVSFIIAHNHPSGDIDPSKEDLKITKRIKESGEILGINMIDHIIIGKNYLSFNENDLF